MPLSAQRCAALGIEPALGVFALLAGPCATFDGEVAHAQTLYCGELGSIANRASCVVCSSVGSNSRRRFV